MSDEKRLLSAGSLGDLHRIIGNSAQRIKQQAERIQALEDGIRAHRDAKGDDRCWLDDQALYALLADRPSLLNTLPPKEVFLANCARFHASRQPQGPEYTAVDPVPELLKGLYALMGHWEDEDEGPVFDCMMDIRELLGRLGLAPKEEPQEQAMDMKVKAPAAGVFFQAEVRGDLPPGNWTVHPDHNKEKSMSPYPPPIRHVMQFFAYDHLPPNLQAVSKPFGDMAKHLADTLPHNPETTVALRKLLESKDCAVRALLSKE